MTPTTPTSALEAPATTLLQQYEDALHETAFQRMMHGVDSAEYRQAELIQRSLARLIGRLAQGETK